jgi:hypothetical protein
MAGIGSEVAGYTVIMNAEYPFFSASFIFIEKCKHPKSYAGLGNCIILLFNICPQYIDSPLGIV